MQDPPPHEWGLELGSHWGAPPKPLSCLHFRSSWPPALAPGQLVGGGGLRGRGSNSLVLQGWERFKGTPGGALISNRLQVWPVPDTPFWVDH